MSKITGLTFLFFISLTMSATLHANENHPALDACFKKAKSYYKKNALPSDTARGFDKDQFLAVHKTLTISPTLSVGGYDTDVVLYKGTGSYHSGYYIDLIVVDANTCTGLDIINIYGE